MTKHYTKPKPQELPKHSSAAAALRRQPQVIATCWPFRLCASKPAARLQPAELRTGPDPVVAVLSQAECMIGCTLGPYSARGPAVPAFLPLLCTGPPWPTPHRPVPAELLRPGARDHIPTPSHVPATTGLRGCCGGMYRVGIPCATQEVCLTSGLTLSDESVTASTQCNSEQGDHTRPLLNTHHGAAKVLVPSLMCASGHCNPPATALA